MIEDSLDVFFKTHTSVSLKCLLGIFFFCQFDFMQKIFNFIIGHLEHIFVVVVHGKRHYEEWLLSS